MESQIYGNVLFFGKKNVEKVLEDQKNSLIRQNLKKNTENIRKNSKSDNT